MESVDIPPQQMQLLAQLGRWCDLDGPLLLARDRDPGLTYRGSLVDPPPPALWG